MDSYVIDILKANLETREKVLEGMYRDLHRLNEGIALEERRKALLQSAIHDLMAMEDADALPNL